MSEDDEDDDEDGKDQSVYESDAVYENKEDIY